MKRKLEKNNLKNNKTINLKEEIEKYNKLYESANTVQKRNITRFIKQLNKEVKKIIYADSSKAAKKQSTDFGKQLLKAGGAYTEIKQEDKAKKTNTTTITRDRIKYEKRVVKEDALNQMFRVKKYYDNLYILLYEQINNKNDDEDEYTIPKRFVVPNVPVIKHILDTEFRKQIAENNHKLKLQAYIAIKYKVCPNSIMNLLHISAGNTNLIKEKDIENRYFNSTTATLLSTHMISGFINDIIQQFEKELETIKGSSDLVLMEVTKLDIKTARSKPTTGGSYIELPDFIKGKRACVNIINTDEKCFLWALLAYKHYDKYAKLGCKNKANTYKKHIQDIIEPEGVTYPLNIDFIPQFEELNNLKINIFEISENKKVNVLYNSYEKYKNVVSLLLFENEDNAHYVWVKDINKLYHADIVHHHSLYRCEYCLSDRFLTKEHLFNHIKTCSIGGTDDNNKDIDQEERKIVNVNETLPEIGKNIMKFKNIGNKFMHPFYIAADFESTLIDVEEEDEEAKTKKYQKHIPNSYGLKYNCIHNEYSKPVEIFNSSNPDEVREHFIKRLEELATESYKLTQQNKKKIHWTKHDKLIYDSNTHCNECKCLLSKIKEVDSKINPLLKVAHHDHITGKFIDTLCYNCNIQFEYKKFIPVYIHNLKGYDSHLFVSSLFKYGYKHDSSENISCIPNNEERYISFSKKISVDTYTNKKGELKNVMYEIRFLDSFAFMASSIESLTDNLKLLSNVKINSNVIIKNVYYQVINISNNDITIKNDNITKIINKDDIEKIYNTDIKDLRSIFKNTSDYFTDDEQFKLMIRKGVYPYDYINSYDKLTYYSSYLPDINEFYSKLNKSSCSKEDYEHAQNVYKTFQCKQFLDYHNIYLKSDVLLLSDIWDNFRNINYKNYELDTAYYYTTPSLGQSAMLKETKINLELITDIDIYNMFEKCGAIRGGVSQISHRHAKANNKYMTNYDETKEDSYIFYGDANNLYAYGMLQHLPTGNFKWNEDEWTTEKILNLDDRADTGYLFDVNISYPVELHDKFNQYPPLPINMSIKKEYLNEWQQKDYHESKIKKLCCTLLPKNNYVVNYRYLKTALSLGCKLEKVNRVLQYSQSNFMKSYIMKNTELRTKAKNDFEKDYYKLMNNSVFGKTMENVRNRINFRLITTEKEAFNVKGTNLKRFTIFDENLVGLHMQRLEIKLCKPIYLGQNILDDAKDLMYKFHYNFMLEKVEREDIDLLFTDTDSLCYHIRKTDIFEIIKKNKDLFDLSEYPEDDPLYDPKNKKVIGKFKNESIKQINEFVGLRAKLYSFTVDGEKKCKNRCKGIKRSVVKNEINTSDYVNTLYTHEPKYIEQNGIRSYGHELYSETQHKIALSARDNKVFISNNNINTYSIGHYRITK